MSGGGTELIDDARLSGQKPPSSHRPANDLNHKRSKIAMAGIRDTHYLEMRSGGGNSLDSS